MDKQPSNTPATGTRDSTYDLTAVLYHALQGVENCMIYMGDAQGNQQHRVFFEQACKAQKQLAEEAKRLLHDALMAEQQGGSAKRSSPTTPPPMGQSHSFAEAEQDGSAFRFASSRTEGGSDQFDQDNSQRRHEPTTGDGDDSRF